MRRVFLALTFGLTFMSSSKRQILQAEVQTSPVAPTMSVEARSKALSALLAEIWEDTLKHSPEMASSLGDKRYDDQLTDYSAAAVNASLSRGLGFIQRLGAIDTTGLPEQEKLSSALMLRSLIEDQESARFKEWQMPINQFNGFHTSMPQLVNQLSFDEVKDYDNYIARLKKIPTAFSQIRTNMEMGMESGRMPPAYLMEKVTVQAQTLADQKPAESPFALPLKKFPKTVSAAEQKRISDEVLAAITTEVLPSYLRFAKFMKAQYVPAGRKEPGVWSLPDGDAYYAFRIRQSTTLNKSASEIHQIGLDEVKRDEAEMLAIVKKLGFSDMKSFSAALKANPKEHPTSKEQLLGTYRGYLDQMKPRLPELFGRLPKAPLEVVAVPAYVEKDQAAAYYEPGTPDGKRPGRVNINTYNFAERLLTPVEAVSYHEGIPGHHLQIAIAQELTGIPEFRKQSYYTAYTEGWGLYSERLGKEIGFYQDPYSDYGRLEADIWRAIRLVVDTGVHSKHWTRQQMVDYFREHSAIDETNIQAEVDRYIAWPGQALGYKMGQLKILELRQRAQTALGPQFSLKAFHDVVLDSGALPMDVLEQQVDSWIAAQKDAPKAR
ncbi:DUF885 domain-containing protein [Granulicella sp. dw_53]|uniref:DUF885 domain-containing protein n=1 Tax=Granulicella sp. dw_53 TaxID=2719792 RepID=UPI002104927B|nr:DUF885 domain-containing protein [Granulicella sp. dw_53]